MGDNVVLTSSPQSKTSRSLPLARFQVASSCYPRLAEHAIDTASPCGIGVIDGGYKFTSIPHFRTWDAAFLASGQSSGVPSALQAARDQFSSPTGRGSRAEEHSQQAHSGGRLGLSAATISSTEETRKRSGGGPREKVKKLRATSRTATEPDHARTGDERQLTGRRVSIYKKVEAGFSDYELRKAPNPSTALTTGFSNPGRGR
jgi:hypothetical protein